jgi:hypothetical protein
MLQAAAINSAEGQYLQITDSETEALVREVSSVNNADTSFPAIENGLFGKVSTFYYKNRVRLSFTIVKEFRAQFVMIKGLIEFNRSKNLLFQYDFKQRTFEADVAVEQLEELKAFMDKVFVWLNQEIQFKRALKLVLDLENRYKVEMEGVYALLNNATAAVR